MKHTLLLYLALAFLLAMPLVVAAQPSSPAAPGQPQDSSKGDEFYYYKPTFGLGLNVGLFSGCGISGRYMDPSGFGAQVTFFVISAFKHTHFNIGVEGQYAFTRRNDTRFYGLAGFGYFSSVRTDTSLDENVIAEPLRIGAGAGYEWFASEQFVWHVAVALTYLPATSTFFPIPEAGFHFYFR